jgi:hypothetical protein
LPAVLPAQAFIFKIKASAAIAGPAQAAFIKKSKQADSKRRDR